MSTYLAVFPISGFLLYKMIKYFKGFYCYDDTRIDGKTVLVTGANAGIGLETAKELAKRGGKVYITCRSEEKCMEAKNEILNYVDDASNVSVESFVLELSSIKSILNFAKKFKEQVPKLDVLINNAGLFSDNYELTDDGFEMTMGVNYIGHFVLTNELLEILKAGNGGRIINVSSEAYRRGRLNYLNISLSQNEFSTFRCYSSSKWANVLHAKELVKRYEDSNIVAVSLHPGVVKTEIWRNFSSTAKFVGSLLAKIFFKNANEGAQTTIYLAIAPETFLKQRNGGYFIDGVCAPLRHPDITDSELSTKLWNATEDLVKDKVDTIKQSL